MIGAARRKFARAMWLAHPARPGPEYAALKQSQWWSRERVDEKSVAELRKIVDVAAAVPHYRDRFAAAGVSSRDLRTLGDIRRLPIFERKDFERLGIPGLRVPGSRGVKAATSGSLGKRAEFQWSLSQMRWLDAGEARARGWLGSDVGDRSLEVRCRPVGFPQKVAAALLNAEALHAPTVADVAAVQNLVRTLEGEPPPTLVWGVSNALYVVALALLENGTPLKARACWSGGNHLHPHYRAALEKAFECTVYERYATMETGLVAHECVEGRMLHVPSEGVLAEIVRPDGSPVGPGETGEVLLTSLRNEATPFIRYRVGDTAVAPMSLHCSCGRGLPLFGRVAGRTPDFLQRASGSLMSPAEAVDVVRPGHGSIVDFQIRQAVDRSVVVSVVQKDDNDAEADRARIASALTDVVEASATVERVDRIQLTPGGKLRTIIREAA